MPRVPLLLLTAVLAVAPAACGSGAPSASPSLRTISRQPSPAVSVTPTVTPSAVPPPARTLSPSARPPAGTGIMGQTIVLNCPVDRADPPCPSTPVRARVVVLDQAGQTVLTTVDTDADGRFTIALPAGGYVLRAAGTGGSMARRPATRLVKIEAGRYTTITIRLITGLR